MELSLTEQGQIAGRILVNRQGGVSNSWYVVQNNSENIIIG